MPTWRAITRPVRAESHDRTPGQTGCIGSVGACIRGAPPGQPFCEEHREILDFGDTCRAAIYVATPEATIRQTILKAWRACPA